jgi:hypothetical protein
MGKKKKIKTEYFIRRVAFHGSRLILVKTTIAIKGLAMNLIHLKTKPQESI